MANRNWSSDMTATPGPCINVSSKSPAGNTTGTLRRRASARTLFICGFEIPEINADWFTTHTNTTGRAIDQTEIPASEKAFFKTSLSNSTASNQGCNGSPED